MLQTKLEVGPAGDHYEQEADRVSKAVIREIRGAESSAGGEGNGDRLLGGSRSEPIRRLAISDRIQPRAVRPEIDSDTSGPRVQAKAAAPMIGPEGGALDADTDSRIRQSAGGGKPLDDALRRSMEGGFGADFSRVRVHNDANAHDLNQRIQAKAFTTGSDIYFRSGEYNPSTTAGQELVAHELTHTIQQGAAGVARSPATTATSVVTGSGADQPMIRRAVGTVPAPYRPVRSTKQKATAKAGWGKIRDKVEQSKQFNEGTNPPSSKELGPFSRTHTSTAGGAWLASQVNSKEKIGSVDDYMGSREDKESAHSKHLEQFLAGGHAFITAWVHKQIFNLNEDGSGWGGWGRDANFIAPLPEADRLVEAAAAPGAGGIWDLEDALGIPPGSWVKGCAPTYNIFRYIVHDPTALNMRIPSGNESNAYASWWDKDQYQAGQWQPGGETEGGAAEAVIDKISLDELSKIGKDVLEIVEETSLAANTLRIVNEKAAAGATG